MSFGSTPNPPKPPPFYPVNIGETILSAFNTDIETFDFSDRKFTERYPGLVAGNNREVEEAFRRLTGPLDPLLQGEFTRDSLGAGMSTFGGGDAMSGLGLQTGAFGTNVASAALARRVMEKQEEDRANWDTAIATNLPRAIGISGADVGTLSIANTGGLNASNQLAYQGQIQAQTAQNQADAATTAALVGMMSSIAGTYNRSQYG